MARDLFCLLSDHDKFPPTFTLSTNQAKFVTRYSFLAIAEVSNVSQALIEFMMKSNQLNELIKLFHEKNVLLDVENISKHWSFGSTKYPQKGMNKVVYRLFYVLRAHY